MMSCLQVEEPVHTSWSRFCTVNHQKASNYQLSNMKHQGRNLKRQPQRLIYLFGVLRRFQHCTGLITMGSWNGRGNQYIQFIRVLYRKVTTNSKQLPAFPLEAMPGTEPPASEVGGESVTTLPSWSLTSEVEGKYSNCYTTELPQLV